MRPLALALLVASAPALAQSPVYGIVEVASSPVGGVETVEARVSYPPEATRAGLHGEALVHATVGADGQVRDATCDAAPSRALCAAAAAAVRASPFRPARIGDRAVASRLSLVLRLSPEAPDAPASASGASASGAFVGPVARLARGSSLRVEYPEMARRAGVEGQQIVQFRIDPSGAPVGATCTRSTNSLLCEAALAAVRCARFLPDGRAVVLPIDFRLR